MVEFLVEGALMATNNRRGIGERLSIHDIEKVFAAFKAGENQSTVMGVGRIEDMKTFRYYKKKYEQRCSPEELANRSRARGLPLAVFTEASRLLAVKAAPLVDFLDRFERGMFVRGLKAKRGSWAMSESWYREKIRRIFGVYYRQGVSADTTEVGVRHAMDECADKNIRAWPVGVIALHAVAVRWRKGGSRSGRSTTMIGIVADRNQYRSQGGYRLFLIGPALDDATVAAKVNSFIGDLEPRTAFLGVRLVCEMKGEEGDKKKVPTAVRDVESFRALLGRRVDMDDLPSIGAGPITLDGVFETEEKLIETILAKASLPVAMPPTNQPEVRKQEQHVGDEEISHANRQEEKRKPTRDGNKEDGAIEEHEPVPRTRLSADIRTELHTRLKREAALRGMRMVQFVEELIDRGTGFA
jgi:hypothetical protein